MCFLDVEPPNQRRSIVTHILEHAGLPRIARTFRITVVVSDDGGPLFKPGGERRKHRVVGFRAVHQRDRRTRSRSSVGDGCAVGFQPTHGASSRR